MVNEVIVRGGFAQVAEFPTDVKYQQRFLGAQTEARMTTRGLWGKCTDLAPLTPAATPVYQQQPVRVAITPRAPLPPPVSAFNDRLLRRRRHSQRAVTKLPDGLQAEVPTDLDCKDLRFRRFNVLQQMAAPKRRGFPAVEGRSTRRHLHRQ